MNIGNVHGSQGRYEEALVQYQKALEVFLAVYGSSEWDSTIYIMMIVLFIVLARNKLRIPLEGTYS